MSIGNVNDPTVELEIPRPVDELGRPRACSMKELVPMIQERADLLFHTGNVKRKYGPSEIEHAQLAFDDPLMIKVRLPVSVPPLLAQMQKSKGRRSCKSEFLQGRGDQLTLEAVQDCADLVKQAERDIVVLSNALLDPLAKTSDLMRALVATSSPATRRFAVEGGTVNLSVDGRSMSLAAESARKSVEYSSLTLLRFRMDSAKRYGAPYAGRVLTVHEGPVGVCYTASRLTLGFLKDRFAERALLEMARDLEVDVLVRVRLAVSSLRLTSQTAEVHRVENHAEILDALIKRRAGFPDREAGASEIDCDQDESC